MKKLSFVRRNDQRHWVGDGFPVRSIFSYNDLGKEMSPFLLLDYAGPENFPPSEQRRGRSRLSITARSSIATPRAGAASCAPAMSNG